MSDESRRNKIAKQIADFEAVVRDAKARGTVEGEAEAEAFTMKIAHLQAKYRIDKEMVRQAKLAKGDGSAPKPIKRNFHIEGRGYAKSRCALASSIGDAMGLSTRLAANGSFVVYIGFPEDIEAAWAMYELIEPQMLAMADRRVKAGEHKNVVDYTTRSGHAHAKSWKIHYFEGFRGRIFARLVEAQRQAEEEVVLADGFTETVRQTDGSLKEITSGRVTGALVLADRKTAVKKYEEELFPAKVNKDGSESKRKPSYWKGPQASRYASGARQTGRVDAEMARIRREQELEGRRPVLTG